MGGAGDISTGAGTKHPLVTEDDGLSPKRQRAPDTLRDVLGGPVVGAKRGRRDEEGDEVEPEAKKAFVEEREQLDEGLGEEWQDE